MKKNYVLDTNVLLHDPRAIFQFEDNDVIIPIFVIEEVDQFKREGTERGRNARTVCRFLDELRDTEGSLSNGVRLKEGGSLRVWVPPHRNGFTGGPRDTRSQDDAILQTAIEVSKDNKDRPTVFVTMDTNLRIRADAVGVHTETYENQRVELNELEGGLLEKEVPGSVVDQFFHDGRYEPPAEWSLAANACVSLRDVDSPSHGAGSVSCRQGSDSSAAGARARRDGFATTQPSRPSRSRHASTTSIRKPGGDG
ncbi:MAG: PIN domain-containing protein [Polyangiaceae bacterium]